MMKYFAKYHFTARIAAALLLVVMLLISILNPSRAFAHNNQSQYAFPSCNAYLPETNGDWSHSDSGFHSIAGIGSMEGSDDVYQLDSGNFLQCFCPLTNSNGIQSNWLNIQRSGLSAWQVDYFKSHGYYQENGGAWNLYHEDYLVKNINFSCAAPTPTPTSVPKSTLTPTPVPTSVPNPTVTPTSGPTGPESKCYQLEAQPSSGSAPLTVRFIAHADDPATNGKIKQYKFFFDDDSGDQPNLWYQDTDTAYHRYEENGTYWASLNIQDYAGNWRGSEECRVKITVSSVPQVLGAETPSSLPSTGVSAILLTALLTLPGVGIYLYKRFRLV